MKALDVNGERQALVTLPPGKDTWYPSYRKLGGLQGRYEWVRKIFTPAEIRSLDYPARIPTAPLHPTNVVHKYTEFFSIICF
jgi:hypothetical protein